jgi:O-antigen ligase
VAARPKPVAQEDVKGPERAVPQRATSVAPVLVWALYILATYIRPHEYVPSMLDAPLQPILLVATFLLMLATRRRRPRAPQDGLMVALLVITPISFVVATRWLGGAVTVASDLASIVVFYFVTAATLDTPARLRFAFFVVSAASAVIAIHGIDQVAEGIGWTGARVVQDGRITYLGFLNDPNDLAMALLIALPMAAHFIGRGNAVLIRIAALSMVAAMLVGVYLTNSRGAFLALVAMVTLFLVRRHGVRRSAVLVPLVLPLLVVLAPSRIDDLSADEASAAGRVDAWYEGLTYLMWKPLFGIGKGQFVELNILTAHNSFVLAFAELGLIGYFVWLSILVLTALTLWRIASSRAPSGSSASQSSPEWDAHRKIADVLLYALVGYAATAFFLSRSYVILLFMLVGMTAALHQTTLRRWPTYPAVTFRENFRLLVTVEIASVAFFFVLVKVLLLFD